MAESLMSSIRKFTWVAAILSFYQVYAAKGGLPQFEKDITTWSVSKLKTNMQYIGMMIGGGILVFYVIPKIKLPPVVKVVLTLIGWYIIGYGAAKTIDPPGGGYQQTPSAAVGGYYGRN